MEATFATGSPQLGRVCTALQGRSLLCHGSTEGGDGGTGERTLAALTKVMHGARVVSPADYEPAAGKWRTMLFDKERWSEAMKAKRKMIQIDRLGYDPDE